MPGVTVSGTGVSNATVSSVNFGGTYLELTLSSGTVTNGATYTFTGPYTQTVDITGSLSATERVGVAYGSNSVLMDQNGVSANNATFSAAVNAGIIQLRPQSNNDIFQLAVSSSAMYNGGGQWSGPQIAAYKDGIGDVSLIGFQTDSSWTDGTVTVLKPLVVSGNTIVSGSLKSTNSFTQAKMSTTQSVTAGSDAVVNFDTINVNNNGWFNTSTHVFTPTVAGTYDISFMLQVGVGTGNGQMNAQVNKNNGTQVLIVQEEVNKNINHTLQGSVLVDMNGTTDNIRITFYTSSNNGSQTIQDNNGSFFKAVLL